MPDRLEGSVFASGKLEETLRALRNAVAVETVDNSGYDTVNLMPLADMSVDEPKARSGPYGHHLHSAADSEDRDPVIARESQQ
jgi:hypothetical protein